MNSKRAFAFLRITFGALWAVDAYFKWSAVFMNGLTGYLTNALTGQPPFVQDWINAWIGIVSPHQHFFAVLVALIETIIAISLLTGFCTRITLVLGSVFALLLWSLPEGFGGPYMAGVTDVGASIIYIFVFAALWIGKAGRNIARTRFSKGNTRIFSYGRKWGRRRKRKPRETGAWFCHCWSSSSSLWRSSQRNIPRL